MAELAGALAALTGGIISLVVYVALCVVLYKVSKKLMDTKPGVGLAVSMLGIFLFPIGIAVPILNFSRYAKINAARVQEKYAIMSDLARDPSDEKVLAFMQRVDSEGGVIGNEPQIWNSFRTLWFSVNENPNVTSQTKRSFVMWLSSKGLILSAKQAEVIDNYKKN